MKKILLNLSGVLLLFMIMPFTALSQTPLTSGVPVNDSVSQGQWKYYSITSSATDTQIEVKIEGLTDDVDLYVKAGSQPTASVYDCRPYSGGTTTETCTLPNTGATTWYIGVNGYEAGSYTVTAVLNSENEVDTITSGVPVNDSVSQGQWKYYSITSSATDTQIEVKIEGLTDDVDLYVKAGSQPTASVYDCRPYGGGTTTETCTLPNTGATTWYIGVNGYEAGSYIVTAVLNSENEVETICDDSLDNDEDGLVDCEDPDCDALTTYFDTGADGFVYADDIFYSTGYPEYASGNYASGDGYSGGGLHVALGGVDGNAITNGMSGGWSKDFTLIVDSIVNITFRYRLVMTWYEPDECSRVLVAIDGTPVPGPDSYLEEVCDGPGDSGWKEVTIDLNLSAGPHTITVGGWNNKKDQYFEITDIYFDDIAIWNMCTQLVQCPCFDAGQIVGVFENSCADGSGGPDGGICNVSMRERLFAAGSEKESESYLVLNVMSGPQTGYQYVAGVERNAVQGCYIRINGEYVLPQTSTDISDSEYELCHRILKEIQIFPTCE